MPTHTGNQIYPINTPLTGKYTVSQDRMQIGCHFGINCLRKPSIVTDKNKHWSRVSLADSFLLSVKGFASWQTDRIEGDTQYWPNHR